jgi:preprotein translocase subunit SecE
MLVQTNEFWAWWSSDGDIKKVESKNRKKTFNFLFNPRKKMKKI